MGEGEGEGDDVRVRYFLLFLEPFLTGVLLSRSWSIASDIPELELVTGAERWDCRGMTLTLG